MGLGEQMRTDNWKNEKHVPVIDSPDQVPANEMFEVQVSIGKEIAHPNTTEHHIRWIGLFFKPDGDQYTYDVGQFAFNSHGESVKGPNQGPVYTHHGVKAMLKVAGRARCSPRHTATSMACGRATSVSRSPSRRRPSADAATGRGDGPRRHLEEHRLCPFESRSIATAASVAARAGRIAPSSLRRTRTTA